MTKPTLWYFPIEDVPSRYTTQLCREWMPPYLQQVVSHSYREVRPDNEFDGTIETGQVLDGIKRSQYSLGQWQAFLASMPSVQDGDIVFLQDFWTPGASAALYSLHQAGKKNVRWYAQVWAQTFDIYDFTFPMKEWMRSVEMGWLSQFAGVFVASSVHKDLMVTAGVQCPIHVIGLPIDYAAIKQQMPSERKRDQVIFCSRFDREKQPFFMLTVAKKFLERNASAQWVVTTSRKEITSSETGAAKAILDFAQAQQRFVVKTGLSKRDYYAELARSRVQFNSSLQDFVAFTLLEACIAGCDIAYPNFRSFPECVPVDRLYQAFDVNSAVALIESCWSNSRQHHDIALRNDAGRQLVTDVLLANDAKERTVW